MNPKFDLFFFKSFNLVFNALDNVKARQYVNSMCIIANIPLIEGGSTGLLGQSYPIIPHHTECYNCRPRGGEEGEKYAICTIRRYIYVNYSNNSILFINVALLRKLNIISCGQRNCMFFSLVKQVKVFSLKKSTLCIWINSSHNHLHYLKEIIDRRLAWNSALIL